MKKLISKILICTMLISVLPKISFADEEKAKSEVVSENEKAKTEEKVEKKEEAKVEEKENKNGETKAEENSKNVNSSEVKPEATRARMYNVTYIFESQTEGQNLPQKVLDKKPENQTNVKNKTVIKLSFFEDIKVSGGTWKFAGWFIRTSNSLINIGISTMVNDEDLDLIGMWTFKADSETQKYSVEYNFLKVSADPEFPEEVLKLKPKDLTDVAPGTVIDLPKYQDVKVEGGTWKFIKWELQTQTYMQIVEDNVTVENANLKLFASWDYVGDDVVGKYNVTYSFMSGTDGKALPNEVLNKVPENKTEVANGTSIPLKTFEDVKVEGGTWKFDRWYIENEGTINEIEGEAVVQDSDLHLVGQWKFEKDPEPKKYNVEFSFYSVTKGKELPDEIKAKLPANQINVLKGTVITLPTYEDVKVEGGKWIFEGWLLETEFGYIDVKNEVVVNNGNLFLAGPWRFEADKKPQPPKPLKPQKPKVQKGRMLPKTNVESAFSYVILALAGIGGVYITKKKDK